MRALKSQDVEELLRAPGYAEFLRLYVEAVAKNDKVFSYAFLARKAGFAARSFPRALAHGKKRMTPATFRKLLPHLGLKGDLKKYFETLVASGEESLNPKGASVAELNERLARLRAKIRTDIFTETPPKLDHESVFGNLRLLDAYAALSSEKVGSSIGEVSQRTRFPPEECKALVATLQTLGLAAAGEKPGFHRSTAFHTDWTAFGLSAGFRANFLASLAELNTFARRDFNNAQTLFLQSTFCVDDKRLPELRRRLRELLVDFVDDTQNPEGNRLTKLVVGFFPNEA